jgi:hypothetical protein
MMGIAQGRLQGTMSPPSMELDFTCQVWRELDIQISAVGSTKRGYSQSGAPVPCEIIMLSDELFFQQAGEDEQIVATVYFAENTDVQHGDIIQVLSNRRLGDATTGVYYYVEGTMSPAAATYGFLRAHVRVGKEPVTLQ